MTEETKDQEINWSELRPQLIKIALEMGPLLIFFLVTLNGEALLKNNEALRSLFSTPLILATAPFMVAMVISLLISWLLFKRVAVMPLVTGVVVLIFGALTIYFQDSLFIKIKPTIVNSLFGATLLGGMLFRQSLLKYVFGEVYHLQPEGWRRLTIRWGVFFFVLAALNEIAWRGAGAFFSDPDAADKFYTGFKLWGTMPVTLVFAMMQMPLLTKYAIDPKQHTEVVPPMDPLP
jgi:intracellular septation protein